MTGGAEALEIFEIEGPFRVRSDGLDVIDLDPPTRVALDALPAIAATRHQAQSGPSLIAIDVGTVALVFRPYAHTQPPPFFRGAAVIRAPWATASTVAAAASIRPVDRDLVSL